MKKNIPFVTLALLCAGLNIQSFASDRHWSFDEPTHPELGVTGGGLTNAPGVRKQSLVFDGASVLQVKDSATATHHEKGFTCAVWVNPYATKNGQQMIAAKNRYSLNEREWGVMIDKDGRYRLYVRQGGWSTLASDDLPTIGKWQHVAVAVSDEGTSLWVNGQSAGSLKLDRPVPKTKALLTFGGVNDNGRIWQNLLGALDEAILFDRVLSEDEVVGLYQQHRVAAAAAGAHALPKTLKPPKPPDQLWVGAALPKASEAEVLKDVRFHVIKKWEPKVDGYQWLHGVGLAQHKGKLYASFGHNRGAENTVTEEAQYRVSEDGGRTWGTLKVIDAGDEPDLAVSHGVFHVHEGALWAFHGAYFGHGSPKEVHEKMKRIHTRAYRLDEKTGKWEKHGVVVENGFWPMNQPVKMADGNWIMPGIVAGSTRAIFPAAVAISHGNDLTKWDLVKIPVAKGIKRMWGESAIFVDGKTIFNIARFKGGTVALVAKSEDFGRNWSPSSASNLPMTTSKPAAGMLSTGQRFLVCSTTADGGSRRFPLTIAVSRPGEAALSKVFVIRHAELPDGPGESHPRAALSYPYTVEHDGKLYIGYSNSGGRGGNHNSAELAVVPISTLRVE